MMKTKKPIAVLGAGSWGTALAIHLANNGNQVILWGHNSAHITEIANLGCNNRFLPNILLPKNIQLTSHLPGALLNTNDVVIAVPSHAFKDLLLALKPYADQLRICSATKGLEPETSKLLSLLTEEHLGKNIPFAIISGPSFALEVAQGLPTAVTLATTDCLFAQDMTIRFHAPHFRIYTTQDLIGVQLGGTIKNVLAIAAGISDGLGFGANARSALITRGLAELVRLGTALGGKIETFMGLAGVGDLVLTCTDNQSRNRRFGIALGKGKNAVEAEQLIGQVVEGAKNAKEVYQLATQHHIEMPITEQVYAILYQNITPKVAVTNLLTRELKAEMWV